ncbi:MAG TPA: TrkA family potassium uptake protein [Promineifilum sp.]
MNVIIMGCGRVGEQLSRFLVEEGHNVTVVDQDRAALSRLKNRFDGRLVEGVGFDQSVLMKAGIEDAEAFVATSASDNANIISARIARNVFHVPRVVARIQDPRRAEIYQRLGLVTVSPVMWGARRILELLTHAGIAPILTIGDGEVVMVSVEVPIRLDGWTVNHLTISGELQVIAIIHDDHAVLPTLGTVIQHGDILYLAVLSTAIGRLEELLDLGGW